MKSGTHQLNTRKIAAIFISALTLSLMAACANVPAPVDGHFNRGVDLYDDGKLAGSIEEYKLAIRQDSNDTFAKYNLAVVYQDQEKYGEALRLYREILNTVEDSNSRINMAAIHFAEGNETLALETLQTAGEKNPDSAKPYSILGEYHIRAKRYDKARIALDKALATDPHHAPSYYRSGRLYLLQNAPDRGLEHLNEAVTLVEDDPQFLEALATAQDQQGQTTESIYSFEKLSVLEPDRADLFAKLGDLYKKDSQYQKAAERYWMAIALQDDSPSVHRNLKETYERLSERENHWLKDAKEQGTVAKNQ